MVSIMGRIGGEFYIIDFKLFKKIIDVTVDALKNKNIFKVRIYDIFKTLSYFDNLNLCDRIKSKVILTCGLKDTICLPSTVFAVYNYINCEKNLEIMPFCDNSHETVSKFEEKFLEYVFKYL